MRFLRPVLILSALLAGPAHAGLLIDQQLHYFDQSTETATTLEGGQHYVSTFVGASIPKLYFIGWKAAIYSSESTLDSTSGTLEGIEMGPRVGMFLSKKKVFSVAVTYLPVHKGTFTSSARAEEKLSGSAFQFELNFNPRVFKHLSPGFSLMYHLGSYSESTSPTDVTTKVDYQRTQIIPSLYLHWTFGNED